MDPTEQERLWLQELRRWWQAYNVEYVGGRLREPGFRLLQDRMLGGGGAPRERTFGNWDPRHRLLGISVRHLREDPWREVAATLRHEMAHQVADEIYRATDEPPHGPAFQKACQQLRADVLLADDDAPAAAARSRLVERVQKLLALSASANEHEASLALRKARRLLLQHDLDPGAGGERRYATRWLGPVKARHAAWEYSLGAVLQDHFCIAGLWVPSFRTSDCKRGSVLEAYGTSEHLELAEHVHTVLWRLLPRLWEQHKTATGERSNRDRQRFFSGVVEGFLAKLREKDRELKEEEGLVPVGDPRLERFVRHINPHIRWVRSGGGNGSAAYTAGVEAGGRVSIDPALARSRGAASQSLGGGQARQLTNRG